MAWTFCISDATLSDDAGNLVARDVYSGHGAGLNQPDLDDVIDTGPIPLGDWEIGPAAYHAHLGPAMALTPCAGTDAKGRSELYIHGDNAAHNHSASSGCVVVNPQGFWAMAPSADRILRVVR